MLLAEPLSKPSGYGRSSRLCGRLKKSEAAACQAGSWRAKLLPVRQAHGERRSCLSGMLMMEEDAPCQYGLSLMRQVQVSRSIVDDAGASSRGGQPVLAGLAALAAPLYGRAVPGPCVTL